MGSILIRALSWQTLQKYAVSGLTCYAGMELLEKIGKKYTGPSG